MPLSMAKIGEKGRVKYVTGKDATRNFLESLGFVEGADATIVSENAGNMIINIKDSRIALNRSMAQRIIV